MISLLVLAHAGDSGSDDYDQIFVASLLTIGGTCIFLGGIHLLGVVARMHRVLLLAFLPAMFIVEIGAAVLMLVDSGLVISIFYLLSTFLSRIPAGFMVAVVIGAVVGIFKMLAGLVTCFRRPEMTVVGSEISLKEQPGLAAQLRALCLRLGAELPNHVVVGLDPAFFVTEARVRCVSGVLKGRTLYISLPLSRLLTVEEFNAVLAHELAHFIGKDTAYSKRFFPVYRGASESVAALAAQSGEGGAGAVAVLPSIVVLSFFLHSFSVAENKVSRERELRADGVAATVGGPRVMSSALIKVHAFAPHWSTVKSHMREILADKKQLVNASALFARVASGSLGELDLESLTTAKLAHPTDSHPTLSTRLQALSAPDMSSYPLPTLPNDDLSAITLFTGSEKIEQDLTDLETAILSSMG